MKELITIQQLLKAPKGQTNTFGKYKYRSCEDILEAVKPLLGDTGVTLTLSDTVEAIGDRYYIKAIATLTNAENESISATAYAREEESKKGMDASQLSGATSSYARKYALNGLFCIDDTKDADATNTHGKEEAPAKKSVQKASAPSSTPTPQKPTPSSNDELILVKQLIKGAKSREDLTKIWNRYPALHTSNEIVSLFSARGKEVENAA